MKKEPKSVKISARITAKADEKLNATPFPDSNFISFFPLTY